jgi:hypothetical protein
MQEQFASLSKELLAANEERIIKEQEIAFWKAKTQVYYEICSVLRMAARWK